MVSFVIHRDTFMLHIRNCASSLAIILSLGMAGATHAADPAPAMPASAKISAPIPVADFFKTPDLSDLMMSPNGKYIAALRPVDGRKKLVIIDLLGKSSMVVAGSPLYDVGAIAWINNDRLRYSVYEAERGVGEQTGGGLFVIDRDGKNDRTINPKGINQEGRGRALRYFSQVPELNSSDIFVSGNVRNEKQTDIYRYDTRTGKKTLLTFDAPEQAASWVLDRAGVPRVAVSVIDLKTTIYYRDAANTPWRTLAAFGIEDKDAFEPTAFDYDNKTLYVLARADGGDRQSVYKYDFAKNKVDTTVVYADKDVDIGHGDIVFSRKQKKMVGARYQADKMRLTWFDPALRDLQASIDAALPGKINIIGNAETTETGMMMVFSYSDRDPGSYYLYDDNKKDLQFLLAAVPWIDPDKMAESRPFRYKARDGLEIPAYLTMPNGTSGKNLPLVVYVHGGPNVRGESWAWHPDAQFMASRGYAVLQPEYRGSTGYGWKLFRSSWKQWGLSMQDDVTDGVKHLIDQGIVDKNRVCIAGASYGGYAVMMGLVKDPLFYQCGINFVGVTDIMMKFSVTWSDYADSDWAKFGMPVMVGDPVKDAAQFKATSPLQNADKIVKPVLMAYGGRDYRVPVVHGEKMRDALKGRVPVEWVVYPEEGHGWNKFENKVDFWTRVENFLNKNIGSK